METIILNICLSDINKEMIFTSKKGKKYINIVVAKMKSPDIYNNTHTVYIKQTKEQYQTKEPKNYIGKGYVYVPVKSENVPNQVEDDLPY